MSNVEKVIKGLECCTTAGFGCIENKECPYSAQRYGSHCVDSMLRDALALLKAQEPRVMTLEEVKALEENTPLYIEQCDGLHGWDVYSGIESGADDIMTGAPWAVAEYWVWSEYGDTWRCWTSRPTDEQREVIPWA